MSRIIPIDPKEAYDKTLMRKDIVIVDLRTSAEYNKERIENSKHIDFFSKNFKEDLYKLDRNKTYLFYCRTNNRSRPTMKILKSLNFQEAYYIDGGINQWIQDGFTVIKGWI